jgi:hypothetical protein
MRIRHRTFIQAICVALPPPPPPPPPSWFKMMTATTIGILVADWLIDVKKSAKI